jgi:hypothetical protein
VKRASQVLLLFASSVSFIVSLHLHTNIPTIASEAE